MANVGNFDRQRMHTQLFGKANFGQLTSREDVLRYRKINSVLGVFTFLLLGYTILRLRFGLNELAFWTAGIGLVLLVVLLFRLGFIKKKKQLQRKNSSRQTHSNHRTHSNSRHRHHNHKRHSNHRRRRR